MINICVLGAQSVVGKKVVEQLLCGNIFNLLLIYRNTKPLISNKSVRCVSFNNVSRYANLIIKSNVIINCIGGANQNSKFEECNEANLRPLITILELISTVQKSIHFVQLSSSAVYGIKNNFLIKETDCVDPISSYGLSKVYAEMLLKLAVKKNRHIRATILRVFSIFSQQMQKQLIFDAFNKIESAGSCMEVHFRGNGENMRSFIHLDTLVEVILKFVINEVIDYNYEIFNVGSFLNNYKVKDLVEKINKYIDNNNIIIFDQTETANDPPYLIPQMQKLISYLGGINELQIERYFPLYITSSL